MVLFKSFGFSRNINDVSDLFSTNSEVAIVKLNKRRFALKKFDLLEQQLQFNELDFYFSSITTITIMQ